MNRILTLILYFPLVALAQQADVTVEKEINRIAFGSCSKQNQPDDQLWKEVIDTNPNLWIWLGDNIYGDSEDVNVLNQKYDLQKSHPDYQLLIEDTEIIGIWDDHDFGVNDGGKEFPAKDDSKKALFNFLDIDQNHPAQTRKGAYQSYTYKGSDGNVKVILLDVRYFRDELNWQNPGTRDKVSIVNPSGDILGEDQWSWFQNQLTDESIDLFIVASGIQVIPSQHRWEKWANFPSAREKLFTTLESVDAPIILLSGDRHLSEVSKIELDNYKYPLYEFTSSSLTSPSSIEKEENEHMIKEKIYETNFASLSIRWKSKVPQLTLQYYGKEGKKLQQHKISYK
ncbi:alkaline phosphatase D family protein [Ekhidna sp.]